MAKKADDDHSLTPGRAGPPPNIDLVGETILHYDVQALLGGGGMGVVYKARDTKLDRWVALKFLPRELSRDPTAKALFLREAKAASAMDHSNICNVHEINETEDGRLFIVMACYEGESLERKLARGRLPVGEALDIAIQAAEGLACAHEKEIVHRDIKPANLMITSEGVVKVLDFGIAKISGATKLDVRTVGTVTYMSPEQTRGMEPDGRADIWSLGVVLHQMLTGRCPFGGPTTEVVIHAIRNDEPASLSAHESVDSRVASRLESILKKCLAKYPDHRYQGVEELLADLRPLRDELATEPHAKARRFAKSGVRPPWVALLAAGLLVVAGLAYYGPWRRDAPRPRTSPTIAVLLFENNTGDPSLDWLRTALTDMLVTDLSQSPDVEVLPTDRLYQILNDTGRLDDRFTSSELVNAVAERGHVAHVLIGSFVKAGEEFRVSVRLQDVERGKILATEKAVGVGEAGIFPMVDDLTVRIRTRLEIARALDEELDRGLKDVTTSSVDAYRFYAEAIHAHELGRYEESIPLYEKAISVDPGFAMALSKLSRARFALGHFAEAERHARQALDHLNRVSARERYFIEGSYYGTREEGYGRAIESFRKALELYPDHASARFELSRRYLLLERYDDAIAELEELRRRGSTLPETHGDLAFSYLASGDLEAGDRVLSDFVVGNPGSANGYFWRGLHLARSDRFDEALDAFDEAVRLDPADELWTDLGRSYVLLATDVHGVDAVAGRMAESSDPFWRWSASFLRVLRRLYDGRTREALGVIDEVAEEVAAGGVDAGELESLAAHILLERGEAESAVERARRALSRGKGHRTEGEALFLLALAQARSGNGAEARRVAEELRQKASVSPGTRLERQHRLLVGTLALESGDAAGALRELEVALSMLPPRGIPGPPAGPPDPLQPKHVPVWYALALASAAAGRHEEASGWLRRIAETTPERLQWPIAHVRSLYFLGRFHEDRGEWDRARSYYERFVERFREGDLDRDRISEVTAKLESR